MYLLENEAMELRDNVVTKCKKEKPFDGLTPALAGPPEDLSLGRVPDGETERFPAADLRGPQVRKIHCLSLAVHRRRCAGAAVAVASSLQTLVISDAHCVITASRDDLIPSQAPPGFPLLLLLRGRGDR